MPKPKLIFALGILLGITSAIGAVLHGNNPLPSLIFGSVWFVMMVVMPD